MIIGIDLGTTNSLAAYFTEDGPKIIPNRLGKHLTPSVVSIDENEQIYVGETAKERMLMYPNASASVFKRDMGTEKKYTLRNKEFKAEELSSFILRSLKEDAEAYLGEEVTEAVISVPAYFNDARRKATKRAGELAGLKVERIISEPTAAAIAYGLYQKNKDTRFLVFDLGGGTFDVSILELFQNILEVHAVAGDNFLGGEDFTEVLVDMFLSEKGIKLEELEHKTVVHIKKQAELCKRSFISEKSPVMSCKINDEILEMTIDMDKYEKQCEKLLERIRMPIKRSLTDANVKLSDIDQVVMVGGATRLPIVHRFVSRLFKILPNTSVNPDEVVALGAAIQAAMKERNEAIKEVILTDVCPFTLGTEVSKEIEENQYESGYFYPIIERNTVIPASRTERLYTVRDNQSKLRINVLQGESRFASNNLSIGELLIDIPKAKAGEEAIDITYTYDINSILEVQVKVVSTGEIKKTIIKGQNVEMTDEEIEQRMAELSYLKIHPREQEANKLLLLKAERLYEESIGDTRKRLELELMKFDAALNTRNKGKIEDGYKRLQLVLERLTEDRDF
ncbi:molecular chaperone HscC [Clostridium cellulovorans]|uniref:Chaperone protein DnaK n=1 Tax=Clostridium cellulovorans (strain ATCC 35296 / DSM 3052 / OCM 3 / 743B) TaxID=573061 RepID=D9SV82_CLOC7|nr:molecular chaperone HscC [Clostridium cellulovorans]ADL53056.1 Heat shock protein 70 [Clostridium cellulovorans 743B]